MAWLVAANPTSVRAHLVAIEYHLRYEQLAAARATLDKIPGGPRQQDKDVLLTSANVLLAEGKGEEARETLLLGAEHFKEEPLFYVALAELNLRANDRIGLLRRAVRWLDALDLLHQVVGMLPEDALAVPTVAGLVPTVAGLLIDTGKTAEAKKLVKLLSDRLEQEKDPPSSPHYVAVHYLNGRLWFDEGELVKAEGELRKCRLARKPDRELEGKTELLLAECYARLWNADGWLKAAQKAVALNPTSPVARMAYAASLWAAGKTDEAVTEYRAAERGEPRARFQVVRVLLDRRDLKGAEEALDGVAEGLKNTPEYNLLKVQSFTLSGDPQKQELARKVIQQACDANPKEAAYWEYLARNAADPKERLAILDQAQTKDAAGDQVRLRLTRADLLLAQKAGAEVLRDLEKGAEGFSGGERIALASGLAERHRLSGSAADAERLLRKVLDEQSKEQQSKAKNPKEEAPKDIRTLFRLFEVVLPKQDPAELKALADDLKMAEGEDGAAWRLVDAARLWIEDRKGKKDNDHKEARKRLAEAGKIRPEWYWVPLLAGEIEESRGHGDAALDHYLRAVQCGVPNADVVVKTARMLNDRRRVAEAQKLIADLRRRTPVLGQEVEWLDTLAALRLGESPENLAERLRRAAPELSTDYRDHVIRGGVYGALGRKAEAEAAFRRAIELAPSVPEPWVWLVQFLARTDRVPDAKAEMEKAAKAVPADKWTWAAGTCYEAVGDRAAAEKIYTQAVRDARDTPAAPAARRALAAFYLTGGEPAKAEQLLRDLIRDEGSRRWARRSLALALIMNANEYAYARATEALELVDANLRENHGSPEDLRRRSLVLASMPGGLQPAIKDLEASFVKLPPEPAEEFMLARLYERAGEWGKANDRFVALLTRKGGDVPRFMAYYVRELIRHDDQASAVVWLDRLKAKLSESSAEYVELQARLDAQRGRRMEAAQAVKKHALETYAAQPNPTILLHAGNLLAELKMPVDAEYLLREYVKAAEAKTPAAVLVLADFLARQNRVGEGLAICTDALPRNDPSVVARVAVAVVRVGEPTAAHFALAEQIIARAAQANPGAPDIRVSLADLRDAQGRYDDAKAMYREILRSHPNNELAMNNLAWLLALHEGNKDEALRLIDQAIRLRGPDGNLLDTRGVIELTTGNPRQAVEDLTKAIAEEASRERYFHLAQAQMKAGNAVEARQLMRKANNLGLTRNELHRLEWEGYKEMLALIGGK
jgi:tetratricopeptide (TPR) repeat protein